MTGKKLVAVGASLSVCLLGALVPPAPSYAHNNNNAIPLIRAFTLAPAAQGWAASLTTVDSDSGKALPAVDVQLRGGGAAKLTPMVETTTAGTYTLALPKAKPGPVQLHLRMRTLPGGTQVVPFDEDYAGTLAAGKPWLVAGSAPTGGSGGGGSSAGPIAAAGAALVLVGGAIVVLRRRRTPPAHAPLSG